MIRLGAAVTLARHTGREVMQKSAVPDSFFDIAAYFDAPYGFAAEFEMPSTKLHWRRWMFCYGAGNRRFNVNGTRI